MVHLTVDGPGLLALDEVQRLIGIVLVRIGYRSRRVTPRQGPPARLDDLGDRLFFGLEVALQEA